MIQMAVEDNQLKTIRVVAKIFGRDENQGHLHLQITTMKPVDKLLHR